MKKICTKRILRFSREMAAVLQSKQSFAEKFMNLLLGMGFSPRILVPRGTGNFGEEYFSPGFPEIPRLYYMASIIFTEILLF